MKVITRAYDVLLNFIDGNVKKSRFCDFIIASEGSKGDVKRALLAVLEHVFNFDLRVSRLQTAEINKKQCVGLRFPLRPAALAYSQISKSVKKHCIGARFPFRSAAPA